jgi:hypothetical protein
MSPPNEPENVSAADFDHAATRLLGAILTPNVPTAVFACRVEAGLAAALELLDREPDLARVLLADAGADPILREHQAGWGQTYADLLSEAAFGASELSPPPRFAELSLVAALRWQLRRAFRSAEPTALLELLPPALELILLYYIEPAEVAPLIGALRASGARVPARSRGRTGSLGSL